MLLVAIGQRSKMEEHFKQLINVEFYTKGKQIMPKSFNNSTEFRLVWYVGNTKQNTEWLPIGNNTEADINYMSYRKEAISDKYTWIEYQ